MKHVLRPLIALLAARFSGKRMFVACLCIASPGKYIYSIAAKPKVTFLQRTLLVQQGGSFEPTEPPPPCVLPAALRVPCSFSDSGCHALVTSSSHCCVYAACRSFTMYNIHFV